MAELALSKLEQLYINGEWISVTNGELLPVYNPASGEILAYVASAGKEDAEKAIQAAREAFDKGPWPHTSPFERSQLLNKLADKIDEHQEELAHLETRNNGKTLRESRFDMQDAAKTFRYYAGLATKPHGETFEVAAPLTSKVVKEPIGVCGQIIPWNYPLLMASWKLAPALAAGNVCILKPSEITPLTAIRLFELIDEVGFPPGVVNLLNGTGPHAGQPLVESMFVDKIAFTGGTKTGKMIITASVGNLKKVSLELGGKSPNIVFADADFDSAVDYAMFAIFNNTGQVCSAGSRLLVEKEIYDRFKEELVKRTQNIRLGNGLDPHTQMGPMASKAQLEKVLDYIQLGVQEGAVLACGGRRSTEGELTKGNFVKPTIFVDVNPNSRIAQEEIFGPVLCMIPFEGEKEALELANGTPFGLAAGIFTSDSTKAKRMARNIRAGVTWINTYEQNLVEGPWGGYKQSGIGRELGTYGYDEYTEVKQIINNLKLEPTGWFD